MIIIQLQECRSNRSGHMQNTSARVWTICKRSWCTGRVSLCDGYHKQTKHKLNRLFEVSPCYFDRRKSPPLGRFPFWVVPKCHVETTQKENPPRGGGVISICVERWSNLGQHDSVYERQCIGFPSTNLIPAIWCTIASNQFPRQGNRCSSVPVSSHLPEFFKMSGSPTRICGSRRLFTTPLMKPEFMDSPWIWADLNPWEISEILGSTVKDQFSNPFSEW